MNIYISSNPKYCTYLTIYYGSLLPSFYIGSTSVERISNERNPYHGSVKSKKYRPIWIKELNDNPYLFKTIILEKFYSRKNALYNEYLLHKTFNVVKSEKFINMVIASKKFGIDVSGDNNPKGMLNKSHSEETKHKISISKIGKISPNRGVIASKETREKMSLKRKGSNNPNVTPVTIDGIKYGCKKDACEALGIATHILNKLIGY